MYTRQQSMIDLNKQMEEMRLLYEKQKYERMQQLASLEYSWANIFSQGSSKIHHLSRNSSTSDTLYTYPRPPQPPDPPDLVKLFESPLLHTPRAPFSPNQNQNNQESIETGSSIQQIESSGVKDVISTNPILSNGSNPEEESRPEEASTHKADSDFGEETITCNVSKSSQVPSHVSQYHLPVFDGTLPDCWIVEVDRFFELEQYENEEKLNLISLSVEGAALKWFRRHRREFTDWTDIKRKLMARFGLVKGCSPPEVLPKEESEPHQKKSHQIETSEVLSSLEPSRRSHNEQLGVSDDFPFANVRTHISQSQSDLKCVTGNAHRMFDVMPLETKPLKNKRKKALQKTWWFKFKTSLERSKLMDDKLSFMEEPIEKDITKLGAQQGFKIQGYSGFDLETWIGLEVYGWEYKKQISIGHISLKGMCIELAFDKDKKKERNIEGDVKKGKNRFLGEGKIILALAVREYMMGKADEMLLLGHYGLPRTFDQCGGLNATVIAGTIMQSSLKSFHQLRVACIHNTSLGFLYGSLPRPPEENHSNFSNMLQYHETWSCISLGESLFFLKKLLSRPFIVGDVTGLTQNKAITKALVQWKEHPPDQFYPENNCCYGLRFGLNYNVDIRSATFMDELNLVCKLLFGAFVLNLIAERTRDWSFFGLLLQWKWHPPPQATSEFHQAHNDKPVFHL